MFRDLRRVWVTLDYFFAQFKFDNRDLFLNVKKPVNKLDKTQKNKDPNTDLSILGGSCLLPALPRPAAPRPLSE